MRVIVAGCRNFTNYSFVKRVLDRILVRQEQVEIVSGRCRGVDRLGEQYAQEKGFPIKTFPADWAKYRRAAGPMRNKQMADYADALVAFDSGGKGTADMIKQAKEKGLLVRVIKINKE
jgi:YspA, cpYpsA-related SLOG family